MAVTRSTLRLARQLRRDVGAEVDSAVRTLTTEWVDAWDGLLPAWTAAADELVNAAVSQDGQWPGVGQIMRMGRVDAAMRGSIAALDKLAERTATVAADGADRVIQLDADREARIVASQAPATEEPGLAAMLAARLGGAQVEALREAWPLRETARGDVELLINRQVHQQTVGVITARAGQQVTAATFPLSQDATEVMRRELIRGIEVGDNPRQAARRMVGLAESGFNGGLTRALNVSRTEMVDAYRATAYQVHTANADVVPMWTWWAELDDRACASCWGMHGTDHPVSDPGPEDHQQGRCARLPKLATWAELGITAPEPPDVTVDPVAVFWALPRGAQLRVMGPTRLGMLEDGRIGWGDLATRRTNPGWRPSYIPTPVRDLQRRVDTGAPPTPRPRPPQPPPTPPAAPPTPSAPFAQRTQQAAAGQQALDAPRFTLYQRPRPAEFTSVMSQAVVTYTGAEYAAVNRHLRNQQLPYGYATADVQPIIDGLDATLDQSRLTRDVVVHRGVSRADTMFGPRLGGDLTGLVWREDAYLSVTAAGPGRARMFAVGESPMVMRILAPAGTPAVGASAMELEGELLLGRGLRLRVVADRGIGPDGVRYVDVEIVP